MHSFRHISMPVLSQILPKGTAVRWGEYRGEAGDGVKVYQRPGLRLDRQGKKEHLAERAQGTSCWYSMRTPLSSIKRDTMT